MTIIVKSRKIIPSVGTMIGNPIILFNGISTAIPAGWSIYTPASGVYVKGASGSTLTLPVASTGTYSHAHTNSVTSSDGVHNHSGNGSTGGNSGTVDGYMYTLNGFAVAAAHSHGSGLSISNSVAHTHAVSNTNSGSAKPASKALYWIKATSGSSVPPIGAITMWSQSEGLVPLGWVICNGSNGTVDLRNLFVYGASSNAEVNTSVGGAHTHTNSSVVADGAHTHTASGNWSGGGGANTGLTPGVAATVLGHSHGNFSVTANSGGAHQHTTPNTDGTSTIPPSMILYYIQRIG